MFKADYDCKIPQSLGAINCTHIFIKGLNCESKYNYYCRKQRYSIYTQAVVGANLCFLDVASGFLGSMHDTRILRQTNLFERTKSGEILHVPVKKIRNVEVRPLTLGDGGYPLRNWLVKPFNFTTALSRKEKRFNRELSSSQVSVERAFGLLKARRRCLLTTLDANIENVPDIIICCFILHKFCQMNADYYDDDENLLEEIIQQEQQGRLRRRLNNEALQNREELRCILTEYVNN